MSYFLDVNEIDKINDSNLDNMKCVAQYNMNENDAKGIFVVNEMEVKNHTISWQYGNSVTLLDNTQNIATTDFFATQSL